jgi:hypothetical protein
LASYGYGIDRTKLEHAETERVGRKKAQKAQKNLEPVPGSLRLLRLVAAIYGFSY